MTLQEHRELHACIKAQGFGSEAATIHVHENLFTRSDPARGGSSVLENCYFVDRGTEFARSLLCRLRNTGAA